jgi:hypothetical protein
MQESGHDTRAGAKALSARRLSLLIMLAAMTGVSLVNAGYFVWRSWLTAAAPWKTGQVVQKINAEIDLTPEGGTLLVLMQHHDFLELACSSYHTPPFPGAPDKWPLSSPGNRTPVFCRGRQVIIGDYDVARWQEMPDIIREYNSRRGSPVARTVVLAWSASERGEILMAPVYDEEVNRQP